MSAAEKIAAIGGFAGFASVIATIFIALDNRKTSKKQLDIAAEANAATKLSIENQAAANAITKLSVDNQLAMSQLARSASIRIAEAKVHTRTEAVENGELDVIGPIDYDGPLAVITLILINDGVAPAYNVALLPIAIGKDQLFNHHRSGYIIQGPDHPFPGKQPFASDPAPKFLSLPAGHTIEFKVALKIDGYDPMGVPVFLDYGVLYEDGLGTHTRTFQFGFHGPGMIVGEKGWVNAVDASAQGNTQQG